MTHPRHGAGFWSQKQNRIMVALLTVFAVAGTAALLVFGAPKPRQIDIVLSDGRIIGLVQMSYSSGIGADNSADGQTVLTFYHPQWADDDPDVLVRRLPEICERGLAYGAENWQSIPIYDNVAVVLHKARQYGPVRLSSSNVHVLTHEDGVCKLLKSFGDAG